MHRERTIFHGCPVERRRVLFLPCPSLFPSRETTRVLSRWGCPPKSRSTRTHLNPAGRILTAAEDVSRLLKASVFRSATRLFPLAGISPTAACCERPSCVNLRRLKTGFADHNERPRTVRTCNSSLSVSFQLVVMISTK